MSKRGKNRRPKQTAPPYVAKQYYGRCDACNGFGYFYRIVESRRRDPDNPGLYARRRRMDSTMCATCCGVGSTIKPGPIREAAGRTFTIPTLIEYV